MWLISAQFITMYKRYGILEEFECITAEDVIELAELILKGRAEKELGTVEGKFTVNFVYKTEEVNY